jgi:hypothetical protein
LAVLLATKDTGRKANSERWKRNQWFLGFRCWAFRTETWVAKDNLLFLVYERLDSESPQQCAWREVLILHQHLDDKFVLKSSNHVQSDNENFKCASGSSICHLHMSTYLNVCVSSLSLSNIYFPWSFLALFSMVFLTSLGNSSRSLS